MSLFTHIANEILHAHDYGRNTNSKVIITAHVICVYGKLDYESLFSHMARVSTHQQLSLTSKVK